MADVCPQESSVDCRVAILACGAPVEASIASNRRNHHPGELPVSPVTKKFESVLSVRTRSKTVLKGVLSYDLLASIVADKLPFAVSRRMKQMTSGRECFKIWLVAMMNRCNFD